jgi:hypothetical protein
MGSGADLFHEGFFVMAGAKHPTTGLETDLESIIILPETWGLSIVFPIGNVPMSISIRFDSWLG